MGMGYVQPSGDIWLFEGVPLSPDHNDVFYITSNANAMEKLKSYPSKPYGQNSYTRTERGTLKIGDNANRLLTYNYLAWKNIRQDGINMWFFAFVTNIGYVNENCTEVSYVIDNYMTWFGFTRLAPCYVDRETVEDDTLFSNLVPESLELGDYEVGEHFTGFIPRARALVVQASTDSEGRRPDREEEASSDFHYYVNGVPSSLLYWSDIVENEGGEHSFIRDTISEYIENGYADNIVQIVTCPDECTVNAYSQSGSGGDNYYSEPIENVWDFTTTINGYRPKNNKLFSYPYQYITAVTSNGDNVDYRLEYWNNAQVSFEKIATLFGLPTIAIVPTNYRKQPLNYEYACYLSNFPCLPWINDPYKAYLAQNKNSIGNSIVSNVLSGLTGGLIGANNAVGQQAINNNATTPISQISSEMSRNVNILSAGTNVINAGLNIASTLSKIEDTKALPATVHGNMQADCFHFLTDTWFIRVHHVAIKREFLQIIDDYFSAYGYAVHQTKIPNINSRPIWNYTKTIGCHFTYAPIPAQAKTEIINMFDSGVRFWKEPVQFGNLLLDNSING